MNTYKVSRKGFDAIKSMYNIPLIEIRKPEDAPSIKNFNRFTIMRKELHLMYDCICKPDMIAEIFEGRENLLIKQILLSMRDFEEIHNEKLNVILEEEINKFNQHFHTCDVKLLEMHKNVIRVFGMF